MTEIIRATTPKDIDAVAVLAQEIWQEYFVPIIGRAQVDYMLDTLQSAAAIARQIADGYEYYLVNREGDQVGYFALVPHPDACEAQLSKIYLRRSQRGRGIGKAILAFVERRCVELGIGELWLTVNRNNTDSIAFYQTVGFTTSGVLVQEIGNGFVMDDFKMVKRIAPPRAEG